MTDATAASEPLPASAVNAEQWIYDVSPAGIFLTTALLFLVIFGLYLPVLGAEQVAIFDPSGRVLGFSDTVWPAFVLILMIGVILGMQHYAGQKDLADSKDYAYVFS